MHNETEIGRLIKDGEHLAAAERLLELLRRNGGNVTHAAITAKVHSATFLRWLGRLRTAGVVQADEIERIRETSVRPEPLASEAKARLRGQIRQERELARVLAWIGRADPQALEQIARRAGTPVITVAKVGDGKRGQQGDRDRVIKAATKLLAARRAAWRHARSQRAVTRR